MKKQLYFLLIFCTSIGFSQNQRITYESLLASSLSEINNNPILIKSDFNNLKLTTKKDNKEFLIPSHSSSYLYFRDHKIGIIITNSPLHKGPILLRQTKLVSDGKKDGKLRFYSKDGDSVTVDYRRNKIAWVTDRMQVKTDYVFDNLSLAHETETQKYAEVFNFSKQEVLELPNNGLNLIGLSEEDVVSKYSNFYELPLSKELNLDEISNNNDSSLLFKGKKDKQFQSVVTFDEDKICKYIKNYYPNDMIKSISDTYDKEFGKSTNSTWTEHVNDKKYSYFIDSKSAKNQFIIHIKMEK
jgi:hypothetical protein